MQNALLEHSAILSTFIKLPFSIKTFVLSIFGCPLKTGFTVYDCFAKRFIRKVKIFLIKTDRSESWTVIIMEIKSDGQ